MTAVPVMARVPLPRDPRPTPTRLPDGRPALRRPAVDLEVVVPAYNEAERLPATVAATVDYLSAAALGVPDRRRGQRQFGRHRPGDPGAGRPGARVPVTVIGCARPGKGAAVRRGVLTSESRYVGFFDADLATPVETLGHRDEPARRGRLGGRRLTLRPGFRAAAPPAVVPPGRRRRVPPADPDDRRRCQRHAVRVQVLPAARSPGPSRSAGPPDSPSTSSCSAASQADGGSIVEIPVAWTDDPRSTFRVIPDGMSSFAALLSSGGADRVTRRVPPRPRSRSSQGCACWCSTGATSDIPRPAARSSTCTRSPGAGPRPARASPGSPRVPPGRNRRR